MLKEHFRCVPAIIEFSNRDFYQNDIVPLCIPQASEHLDPPLVDVFVKVDSESAREQFKRPMAAVKGLSPQQQTAFHLRFLKEFSIEEVAEAMGVGVGREVASVARS